MVNKADQLTERGFATQIQDVVQRRVMVPLFPHLDEENAATEQIDQPLETVDVPPLDRKIELATGADDPERKRNLGDFLHLGNPGFFLVRNVNVPFEVSRF